MNGAVLLFIVVVGLGAFKPKLFLPILIMSLALIGALFLIFNLW